MRIFLLTLRCFLVKCIIFALGLGVLGGFVFGVGKLLEMGLANPHTKEIIAWCVLAILVVLILFLAYGAIAFLKEEVWDECARAVRRQENENEEPDFYGS